MFVLDLVASVLPSFIFLSDPKICCHILTYVVSLFHFLANQRPDSLWGLGAVVVAVEVMSMVAVTVWMRWIECLWRREGLRFRGFDDGGLCGGGGDCSSKVTS